MNRKFYTTIYIVSDLLASAIAWGLFYFFRKMVIEKSIFGDELPITPDNRFMLGMIIIPFFWVILYIMAGYYTDVYRKSRLNDLGNTFFETLAGTIIIFFTLILDDFIGSYTNYYLSFAVLFSFQFFLTWLPRYILTSTIVKRIHSGVIGFNTIIIGGNGRATQIYDKIRSEKRSTGNRFIGFVTANEDAANSLSDFLPCLGSVEDLSGIISGNNIEEVIIAIEEEENRYVETIISKLNNNRVIVKAIPGMHDILLGRVKMSSIFGTPLILLNPDIFPAWQANLKQVIDVLFSIVALIITLPISLVLAIAIKVSGAGPVIYSQERIGLKGRPFRLYKFRSMVKNAEKDGPELSGKDDMRITKVGRMMRKHRLDEIPNFINVLKGDMSLVGPRPERRYYIDRIVERAPHYNLLLKVKPGITSWGQVKYGYASNIDKMIERLEYDLIYLENMSLYVDFKIIIYTMLTVLRGKGV